MREQGDRRTSRRDEPEGRFTDRASFAAALDARLSASPLSLRDLARRSHTSAQTISGWRTGKHLPYPRQDPVVEHLLRELGVDDPQPWLDGLATARTRQRSPVGPNPYRGLEPFTEANAESFFGRTEVVDELWQRVQEHLEELKEATSDGSGPQARLGPIFLVGASGSGKTSILRAGLVHRLRQHASPVDYVLADPHSPPSDSNAHADNNGNNEGSQRHSGAASVLVFDQFETVLGADPELSASYVEQLALLSATGRVIVIGLRADHYHLGLAHDYLAPGLRRPVIPDVMTDERVADCIELPAQLANMTVDPELTWQLLADFGEHARTGGVGEVLPLLSHVLYTMADHPDPPPRALTLDRYHEVGGLAGAIRDTAEGAYRSLSDRGRRACRNLLTSLVEPGRDSLPVRRPARLDALGARAGSGQAFAGASEVIEVFVKHRLLTVERETVTISHEALLRAWPQLATWIDEHTTSLMSLRRIRAAHEAWEASGGDSGSLLAGLELETATALADQPVARGQLSDTELAFVEHSQTAAQRQRRNRRWIMRGVGAAAVVAVVLAGAALGFADQARTSSDEARSRQLSLLSLTLSDSDPALSTQLAIASYAQAPTVEARSAVLGATGLMPSERYLGQPGPTGLAASAGGERVAYSDSVHGRIVVMERSPTGYEPIASLQLDDPEHDVYGLAMSPDGALVAFGGTDLYANLWDVDRNEAVVLDDSLTDYQQAVQSVVFSPDGTEVLASGTSEAGVGRWEVGKGPTQATRPVLPSAGSVMSIAVDSRMQLAATGNDNGEVRLWSLDNPSRALWSFTTDDASSALAVALSPDGRYLAAGFRNGTMALWNVSEPAAPDPIELPTKPFGSWTSSVGFSPSGNRFVAASSDGHARLWDVDGWEPLGSELSHPNGVTNARLVADDTAIIALADGSVRVWNLDHQLMTSLLAPIWAAELGQDGDTLLALSRERAVLWSVGDEGQLHPTHDDLRSPDPYTFTGEGTLAPDGRTIVAGTSEGSVLLLRLTDGGGLELVRALDSLGSLIESVELSPDGATLAAVGNHGRIGLWELDEDGDTRGGGASPASELDLGRNTVAFNLAIDPGGGLLAVTSSDGKLHLLDITDPTQVEELAAVTVGDDSASGVAFHPHRPIVAVGNHDNTVSLWDYSTVTDPQLVTQISGPNGRIHDVDFDGNGDRLAASTSDGMAWMWDVADAGRPNLLAKLTGEGQMYSLTFSPDGSLLVGAGASHLVTVWKTDAVRAATELCRDVGDPITEAEWHDLVPGVPFQPPCPHAP